MTFQSKVEVNREGGSKLSNSKTVQDIKKLSMQVKHEVMGFWVAIQTWPGMSNVKVETWKVCWLVFRMQLKIYSKIVLIKIEFEVEYT